MGYHNFSDINFIVYNNIYYANDVISDFINSKKSSHNNYSDDAELLDFLKFRHINIIITTPVFFNSLKKSFLEFYKTYNIVVWVITDTPLSFKEDFKYPNIKINTISKFAKVTDLEKQLHGLSAYFNNLNNTKVELLEYVLKSKKSPFLVVNKHSKILYFNSAFENVFKYDFSKIYEKHFSVLLEAKNKSIDWFYQLTTDGFDFDRFLIGKTEHNTTVKFKLEATLIQSDLLLLTIFDHTEVENLKEKLQKSQKQINEAAKVKNDFLSTITHEIRTPLSSILGFTDLILESTDTTHLQKKYLQIIKKSSTLFLSSMNDIIDLSKLESGKLYLNETPFNLRHSISQILALLTIEAKKKGLQLKNKFINLQTENLLGDQKRLQQILLNLLKNSIKFTKDGVVSLTTEKLYTTDTRATYQFTIRDTGIGFNQNKKEHIFNAFSQSEHFLKREYNGFGVSLTLVKELIKVFNGTLEIVSRENRGTVINCILDFTLNNKKVIKDTATINPANVSILVAEDNLNNQILLKTRLNSWGFNVTIANNGLDVLEQLNQRNFDLILMDLQMPQLDGYATTKQIRKQFTGKKGNIPVIAITAHASLERIGYSHIIEKENYIYKPFDAEKLYNKIIDTLINASKPLSLKTEINLDMCKVDFDYVDKECLGNPDIIKTYIEFFILEFEEFLTKSKHAAKQKNYTTLFKSSHKILPSVKGFKLNKILKIIYTIHDNSKLKQNIDYSNLIKEIETLYVCVNKQLKEKLAILKN